MSAKKNPANMVIAAVPVPTRKLGTLISIPPEDPPNDAIYIAVLLLLFIDLFVAIII
jgi:hypothetical protein